MTDRPDTVTELIRAPDGGLLLKVPRIRVVVVDGRDRGREVRAERPSVRVGTHASCDLVLTDPTVSREHCTLSPRNDMVRVVDHRSSNGTFLDAARVREVDVPPGTLVRVGQTTLRITSVDDPIHVPLSDRDSFGAMRGRSARMRELFAVLERVAPTDSTLLVEGESGTGKELVAEAVHGESARQEGPFVVFDCAAVPRELAESALFGHVRGAFTGAVGDRRGVFEEAHGGTLFLDEIGELAPELQPKLLRVLERREVRPVGGSETRPVDVRIVAATNRSLADEVNAGRFREDLYYRLAVVEITVPPLRSRAEDIPLLVEHFVAQLAGRRGDAPRLSPRAVQALAAKPWPGNVRQLRNAVERALALSGAPGVDTTAAAAPDAAAPGFEDLLALGYHEARALLFERFERRYVQALLDRAGGNVSAAARAAGVNRKLVQRMMREHGLRDDDDDEP